MKITVYTISTCPFSKQEKDYLASHKLTFEEKNIEEHREYLAEMLQAADKFAGVPFTVVEKDDGNKVNLKGFTKEEFDKELGLVQAKQEPAMTMANAGIKVPPPVSAPMAPIQPKMPPVAPPPPPPPPSPVASAPPVAAPIPSPDESLKSVLDNLQQKTEAPDVVQPTTSQPATSQPATNQPSLPPTDLPKIPDFPK